MVYTLDRTPDQKGIEYINKRWDIYEFTFGGYLLERIICI